MIKNIFRRYKKLSPINHFLVNGGILYAVWRIFRKFTILYNFDQEFTFKFADYLLGGAYFLLKLFGFDALVNYQSDHLAIQGSEGVRVVFTCIGLNIMVLFAFFLIAYPGNVKTKLWYIPIGILAINLLNIIRIAVLTVVMHYIPEQMDLLHHFVFQAIMYIFVIGLWLYWIARLNQRQVELANS